MVNGTRLRSQPGTARPGQARPAQTGNRSRFCEANNFLISAPIELDIAYIYTNYYIARFFKFQKCNKYSTNTFKRFPKKMWAQSSKNCCES